MAKKKIADYIEEHLSEELPLSELAATVGLSPFHFARAFKRSFGIPPHRYHVSRRIERAKALLAAERSVTEVAIEVGFAETSSFSAAFRKSPGFTPTAFRRVNARLLHNPITDKHCRTRFLAGSGYRCLGFVAVA